MSIEPNFEMEYGYDSDITWSEKGFMVKAVLKGDDGRVVLRLFKRNKHLEPCQIDFSIKEIFELHKILGAFIDEYMGYEEIKHEDTP